MTPRRKERTARFTEAELVEFRRHFGSITHAFEILLPHLQGAVRWSVFRFAVSGNLSRPGDLDAIRNAVRAWKTEPR